jgi:hypothetical protein
VVVIAPRLSSGRRVESRPERENLASLAGRGADTAWPGWLGAGTEYAVEAVNDARAE